jgi:hypothetical protein
MAETREGWEGAYAVARAYANLEPEGEAACREFFRAGWLARGAEGEWRPISDEAKNGEPILAWSESHGYAAVDWWTPTPSQRREGAPPCGWQELPDGPVHHPDNFTHWQPLPSPPKPETT